MLDIRAARIHDLRKPQCRETTAEAPPSSGPSSSPEYQRQVTVARTHGRKGRPWERLASGVIGLWLSQGKPCPRCGKGIDPVGTWPARHPLSPSVDHIVPLSVDRSRAHDPSNLRVLHYGCNAARGNGTHDAIKRTW